MTLAKPRQARGSKPKGVMNKLESDYAALLDLRKAAGEVYLWEYESLTFKLAPRTTYTPDFLVIMADMSVELHETKGFERDDGTAKFKIAAAQFPYFRFVMVKRLGKNFVITRDSRA